MKLLTLNTHSLIEENYEQKLITFTEAIAEEVPDIIALQEVNQSVSAKTAAVDMLTGYVPADRSAEIKEDNHVCRTANILAQKGIHYFWTWIPLKCGYEKYVEGIAIMSRSTIADTRMPTVSRTDDFYNWKTRKLLGICTDDRPDEWFYSVHYGWWNDDGDPFRNQWHKSNDFMRSHKRVWLMGDFNCPAEVRNEGYDMIRDDGWQDSFMLAEKKDSGQTVGQVIDGWRDKEFSVNGMRIDQIWCSGTAEIKSSEVIFNNKKYPVVSDHFGIIIETG